MLRPHGSRAACDHGRKSQSLSRVGATLVKVRGRREVGCRGTGNSRKGLFRVSGTAGTAGQPATPAAGSSPRRPGPEVPGRRWGLAAGCWGGVTLPVRPCAGPGGNPATKPAAPAPWGLQHRPPPGPDLRQANRAGD